MATVYRFGVNIAGWTGGPGRNTWHMCQAGELGGADQSDLEGIAADIAAVYDAVKSHLINGLTVDIDATVDEFDVATGALQRVIGITPPATVTGSAAAVSGNVSRATQATVRFKTDAVRGNRSLQGRHFLGPVANTVLGSDGNITSAVAAAFGAAYGGVIDVTGNGRLVVWGQPSPTVPALAVGMVGYVQQAVCNRIPGTLRSRKV